MKNSAYKCRIRANKNCWNIRNTTNGILSIWERVSNYTVTFSSETCRLL